MGTDGSKFDVSDRLIADRLNRKTVLADTGVEAECRHVLVQTIEFGGAD